jgi:hypothetical protein
MENTDGKKGSIVTHMFHLRGKLTRCGVSGKLVSMDRNHCMVECPGCHRIVKAKEAK